MCNEQVELETHTPSTLYNLKYTIQAVDSWGECLRVSGQMNALHSHIYLWAYVTDGWWHKTEIKNKLLAKQLFVKSIIMAVSLGRYIFYYLFHFCIIECWISTKKAISSRFKLLTENIIVNKIEMKYTGKLRVFHWKFVQRSYKNNSICLWMERKCKSRKKKNIKCGKRRYWKIRKLFLFCF